MKTCLDCKYEPDWGEWVGKEYVRRSGTCKWNGKISVLPATHQLTIRNVIQYDDDSGVETHCKTWEVK